MKKDKSTTTEEGITLNKYGVALAAARLTIIARAIEKLQRVYKSKLNLM